jgi:phage tail protein X
MSGLTYTTQQGDTLDSIAFALTGATAGTTEALISLNPTVVMTYGPVLPLGVTLQLPSLEALTPQETLEVITLW